MNDVVQIVGVGGHASTTRATRHDHPALSPVGHRACASAEVPTSALDLIESGEEPGLALKACPWDVFGAHHGANHTTGFQALGLQWCEPRDRRRVAETANRPGQPVTSLALGHEAGAADSAEGDPR